MTRSIDNYLHRRRTREYDCLAFAAEVWRDLTGEDLAAQITGAFAEHAALGLRRKLHVLERPRSPCLVLLNGGRSEPHIGVYVDGRVLHLGREAPAYQPLWVAAQLAPRMTFFDTRVGEAPDACPVSS